MRTFILGTAVMALSASLPPSEMAHAADLKLLSSVALTSVLDEFTPTFEKATGNKLNIGYGLAIELKKRILDGETADVIILTRPMMDEVEKQNKFLANSIVNAAGTPVSVAARIGAPKPDISSVDAFEHTLLSARSETLSWFQDSTDASSMEMFHRSPGVSRLSSRDGSTAPGPARDVQRPG